jgi:1-acyl-sn-glycerol-3-phosphate acyltransferase
MLDLPRLHRIRLTEKPFFQDLTAWLIVVNYSWFPGVEIDFEHLDRVPDDKVIFAMNHTDRYNYFPFLHHFWSLRRRYMATWVKGKYYENGFVGGFMEKTNQLPTVSRGYIITKEFEAAVGRVPSHDEYDALRRWVDGTALGPNADAMPDPGALPKALFEAPRNALGVEFDPAKTDFATHVNEVFRRMMSRFVELNEETRHKGLDILIFPQGTRSIRLLPSHVGISQMALHLKQPIVPVGCNGCDKIYPGASPWAKKGRVVYRFGEPITYEELSTFHISEPFAPFSAEAERKYAREFEGVAALVTDRIDALLDPEYRRAEDAGTDAVSGMDRFV